MTCDVKWKSLATKVEREVAHDKSDLDSDTRHMLHGARFGSPFKIQSMPG